MSEFKCKVAGCGRSFKTEQALKVHIKRVHSKAKPIPVTKFRKRPKDDE